MGYGDDFTLLEKVASPRNREAVTESLLRDFGIIDEWFLVETKKCAACKRKKMFISRSQTGAPRFPVHSLNDVILVGNPYQEIHGVTFHNKMSLESHLEQLAGLHLRGSIL